MTTRLKSLLASIGTHLPDDTGPWGSVELVCPGNPFVKWSVDLNDSFDIVESHMVCECGMIGVDRESVKI